MTLMNLFYALPWHLVNNWSGFHREEAVLETSWRDVKICRSSHNYCGTVLSIWQTAQKGDAVKRDLG